MRDISDSGHAASAAEGGGEDPAAMERRIFRATCVVVATAAPLSAALAPWRVTTGLLLGGLLALLNHHWLRTSVEAMFGAAPPGARPRLRIARYVLRYVVVALVVAAAHWAGAASLVATLAGMCAPVVALLVEGAMQLYFAVIRREET